MGTLGDHSDDGDHAAA